FSRLFQMVALELLGIHNFTYLLSYKSFGLTIGVFAAIFIYVIIQSSFSLRKLDIADIFKKARKGESQKKYSLLLGLTGVFCILASCLMFLYLYHNRSIEAYNTVVLTAFILPVLGIYLIISNLGNGLLQFIRTKPEVYYRNLLNATEINQKFKQNKKILVTLSILSTMIILFVGMTFSMYSQSIKMAEVLQPNHLEYIELNEINKISSEELTNILNSGETSLVTQNTIEFLSLKIIDNIDPYDQIQSKPFIPVSTYNRINNTDLQVKKGEVVNIVIPGIQIISNYSPPLGKLKLQVDNAIYEVHSNRVLYTDWISGLSLYPSRTGMVINDEDYLNLKKEVSSEQIGQYHRFIYKDWKNTGSIVSNLRTALEQKNKIFENSEAGMFSVKARIEFFQEYKNSYSLGIFVNTIIGILFFIASINVLYFKQFSEIASAKEKFYKLYKIGITEKEIKQKVAREMKIVFFVPLILAIIPGLTAIWFSNSMLGGQEIMSELMKSALLIIFLYFVFQTVFYYIIKESYYSQIVKSL
ncbi:MAG: hypothetical protein ACOC2J_03195, partial [bacterium]